MKSFRVYHRSLLLTKCLALGLLLALSAAPASLRGSSGTRATVTLIPPLNSVIEVTPPVMKTT